MHYSHTKEHTWIVSHHDGPLYIGAGVGILTERLVNPVPLGVGHKGGGGANGWKRAQRRVSHSCKEYGVDENYCKLFGRSWDVKYLQELYKHKLSWNVHIIYIYIHKALLLLFEQ